MGSVNGLDLDPRLLASAAVLALAGALVAWARNLPAQLWELFLRHFSVSVTSRDQDLVRSVGVTAVECWKLGRRRTSAFLKTVREENELAFEPARGVHLVRWRGRLVLLDRGKEDAAPGGKSGDLSSLLATETVSLRGFGRNPAWLHEMLAEANVYGEKRFRERPSVRVCSTWGEWSDLFPGEARSVESVILPEGVAEMLCARIQAFLDGAAWYAERGIPWRLSIGVFGPPGTGKGSIVRALCGKFDLPLHLVDISNKNMTDTSLLRALATTGPRSAVLFDDLDATRMPTREESYEAEGGVTLAGLLGCLDGPGAAEGRVVFICSNCPEKIDPALLRAGRCDIRVDLAPATAEQAKRLYLLWYPGDEDGAAEFAEHGVGASMADLQGRLLARHASGSSS